MLIAGAEVYDGAGGTPTTSDVMVRDGRIAAVGPDLPRTGIRLIDGRALAVAPGFIDMHSHADFTLPAYPAAVNSVSQGVTTEVVGNCAWSPAPLAPPSEDHRAQWQDVATALGPDLAWSWSTFGEFLDTLDAARPAVNAVALVGHSAIRAAVFGIEDRPPTTTELAGMVGLLDDALAAGAWGMSTGLVYPPSSFAAATEVATLAARLAKNDALYSTHMRDEGADLSGAVDEAVTVADKTGVRVEISHLKAAGPASHGRVGEALARIDAARAAGLDVGCDAYPYLAGSTVLTQLLPSWAMEGGVAELLGRLRSTEMRTRIRAEVTASPTAYLNKAGGWANVMIANVEDSSLKRYEGRFLQETARHEGQDEWGMLFEILETDSARSTMIMFMMDQADVDEVLDHSSTVIGSDALGVHSASARVHPRAYGTFARVMARASQRGAESLGPAIAQATGETARRLGMTDRGRISVGQVADLVVFDPQEIGDTASYESPTNLAEGIRWVFLGGETAMAGGEIVNPSLGRVLRKPSKQRTSEVSVGYG